MNGRSELEITYRGALSSKRVTVEPVQKKRTKPIAIMLGLVLALGPGLWAAWKYTEVREENQGREPVAARESVEVMPGDALSFRDGVEQPAIEEDEEGGLGIDLGEIQGGESASYVDLIRIRNDGTAPVLVYVEPSGISDAPLHASVSGEEAPGAFQLDPGEVQPVDLALAADIMALPGDQPGALVVKTASGLFTERVPAFATVTAPPLEELLDTLLAAAKNPAAGLGRVGEVAAGMEAPDFTVEGVWDGGIYGADVELSWEPVGPLSRVRGTVDGNEIGRQAVVSDEGVHVLRLEGYVLEQSLYAEELSFTIDKTAPESAIVTPPLQAGDLAKFAIQVADANQVTGVDLVLLQQPERASSPEPEATPTPTAAPTATPRPTASPDSSSSPSPSGSPDTSATPTPTSTPKPSATPEPSPTPEVNGAGSDDEPTPVSTTRIRAKRDATTGLWMVDTNLEPGTYVVYAEARDVAGNLGTSGAQVVEVIGLETVTDLAGL